MIAVSSLPARLLLFVSREPRTTRGSQGSHRHVPGGLPRDRTEVEEPALAASRETGRAGDRIPSHLSDQGPLGPSYAISTPFHLHETTE